MLKVDPNDPDLLAADEYIAQLEQERNQLLSRYKELDAILQSIASKMEKDQKMDDYAMRRNIERPTPLVSPEEVATYRELSKEQLNITTMLHQNLRRRSMGELPEELEAGRGKITFMVTNPETGEEDEVVLSEQFVSRVVDPQNRGTVLDEIQAMQDSDDMGQRMKALAVGQLFTQDFQTRLEPREPVEGAPSEEIIIRGGKVYRSYGEEAEAERLAEFGQGIPLGGSRRETSLTPVSGAVEPNILTTVRDIIKRGMASTSPTDLMTRSYALKKASSKMKSWQQKSLQRAYDTQFERPWSAGTLGQRGK